MSGRKGGYYGIAARLRHGKINTGQQAIRNRWETVTEVGLPSPKRLVYRAALGRPNLLTKIIEDN